MYAGGRAGRAARWFARVWGWAMGVGVVPRRWVVLEVPGRTSGRLTRIPLGMADVDGRWYLVSMLGECHWVRNVRAAGLRATLVHGRRRSVRLVEVRAADRAPILRRYVAVAPGGRPHIPVDRTEPVEAFAAVAERFPVFEVLPG
jgi:hypothetical protein